MVSKSKVGQTTKYSSILKKVQDKREGNITPTDVIDNFKNFGFIVNDRNHNDIAYWTSKPRSDLSKMIEDLHNRRMEINKVQDSLKNSEHMRNSANRQKIEDELFKQNIKGNDVKKDPEGKGGPQQTDTPPDNQIDPQTFHEANSSEDGIPSSPFFVGEHALVHIKNANSNTGAGTIWLVDPKKKILRPFLSEQAFNNAFKNPAEARKAIVSISSKELGPGGVLDGFTLLKTHKGVNHDGSMPKIEFGPGELQERYGNEPNPEGESKSLALLDSLIGSLKKIRT